MTRPDSPYARLSAAARDAIEEQARAISTAYDRARELLDGVALQFGAPDERFCHLLQDDPLLAVADDGWVSTGVAILFDFAVPAGVGRGEQELRGRVDLQLLRAPAQATVVFGPEADHPRAPTPFETVEDLCRIVERAARRALLRPVQQLRAPANLVGFHTP